MVVVDLVLPGESGLELINDIRQLEACATLPIVVFTGLTSPSVHNRARELGVLEVFTKSMDMSGCCESVEKIYQMLMNAVPASSSIKEVVGPCMHTILSQ